MFRSYVTSPLGLLEICATETAVTRVYPVQAREPSVENALTRRTAQELEAYFAGTLRRFTAPLAPAGTAFQQAVWQTAAEIGFGQTVSYGELAARMGRAHAARAVGAALGRNPILILIPCHRIVGRNGGLTGYAAGLARKEYLLRLEAGRIRA